METEHSRPSKHVGLRFWIWIKTHKLKAFLGLLGLIFLIEVLTIPWFDVAILKTRNPAETALMRQRAEEAESAGKRFAIKHKWIPLSQIPRSMVNAVVVAEDGTFWQHNGFDWFELKESFQKNWDQKRIVRGASTITQQLAKNLYLSTSKDPIRKLKEAVITFLLENDLDKNRIMEIYLNVIEWGRGIFGIEAAAQTYFGRSAHSLTFDQTLRLAAVIPSPLRHHPNEDSRYVLWRKKMVLTRMEGRDYAEPEPVEDEETDELQYEEVQPSQPSELTIDSGSQAPNIPIPDTLPRKPYHRMDSTEIERNDTNDIQRREHTD